MHICVSGEEKDWRGEEKEKEEDEEGREIHIRSTVRSLL